MNHSRWTQPVEPASLLVFSLGVLAATLIGAWLVPAVYFPTVLGTVTTLLALNLMVFVIRPVKG